MCSTTTKVGRALEHITESLNDRVNKVLAPVRGVERDDKDNKSATDVASNSTADAVRSLSHKDEFENSRIKEYGKVDVKALKGLIENKANQHR